MLYLCLSLATLVISCFLWRLGRRGKRRDDHPVCRKCGYDLNGLPTDSLRCSECGSDIKAKRAVRIGNRRPFTAVAWIGITLAFLSLPAVAFSGYNWWQHFNKWPWIPFSMLEGEYKKGNVDARQELESRISRGKISKAQASQLVRDVTNWQDDPTFGIPYPFDIVSTRRNALLAAGADPALLDAFDDHPYRIDVKYHAQVARATFFPFRLTFDVRPDRFWNAVYEVINPKARIQVGDSVIALQSPAELPLSEAGYDSDSMVVGTDAPEFWRHEHDGRIEGTLTVEVDVPTGRPAPMHVIRTTPFCANVVAAGSPTISVIASPATDAQMTAAFQADHIEIDDQGRIMLERILPDFRFQIGSLPENVAMNVYFEQAGRKWSQGVLIRAAAIDSLEIYFTPRLARDIPPVEPQRYFIGSPWSRGFSRDEFFPTDIRRDLPLELVLKSDPDLAATHSGFDRVWQGEIRIPIPILGTAK